MLALLAFFVDFWYFTFDPVCGGRFVCVVVRWSDARSRCEDAEARGR